MELSRNAKSPNFSDYATGHQMLYNNCQFFPQYDFYTPENLQKNRTVE